VHASTVCVHDYSSPFLSYHFLDHLSFVFRFEPLCISAPPLGFTSKSHQLFYLVQRLGHRQTQRIFITYACTRFYYTLFRIHGCRDVWQPCVISATLERASDHLGAAYQRFRGGRIRFAEIKNTVHNRAGEICPCDCGATYVAHVWYPGPSVSGMDIHGHGSE
jgi:hypothetical protein